MPKSKKKKTERERANQKARTTKNKERKYQLLLKNSPDSIHKETWVKKLKRGGLTSD